MSDERYEVYAVRYATLEARRRNDNFISNDPHDGPMPIDFYVWALKSARRTIVVDTGFDAAEAERRGRALLRNPTEGLAAIGVDAAEVEDVVVTHLHYDHAGNTGRFPRARFHLQDTEMGYATGRCMCHQTQRVAYSVEYVTDMVRLVYGDRVCFHDGADEIAPGVSIHHVGGHTRGLQVVRVATERGHVVLASDASHFYGNMEGPDPFPIVDNLSEMLEGYRTLERLADTHRHIVPGHDPLVLARYPAAGPSLEGIAARLDVEPRD